MRDVVRLQASRQDGGHVTQVMIGGERFWLSADHRPDGTLGRVSIGEGQPGGGTADLLGGYAAALSMCLEHGVPLAELLRPGLGLRFAPGGPTNDPELPRACSPVDYICRRLAVDWLTYPERTALGVLTGAGPGAQPAA